MKPIIFSTPMVQAILDGRKTQTRRIVKVNIADRFVLDDSGNVLGSYTEGMPEAYPTIDDAPYQEGDILWVRETWQLLPSGFDEIPPEYWYIYKATDELSDECTRWRPSIFMPREAARLFLRVKNVRVERLQDITEEDAIAEGMSKTLVDGVVFISAKGNFHVFWDSLNIKRGYGWDTNPWVWVIEFERINKGGLK